MDEKTNTQIPVEDITRTKRIAELEKRIDLARQKHKAGVYTHKKYIDKTRKDSIELNNLYKSIIEESKKEPNK